MMMRQIESNIKLRKTVVTWQVECWEVMQEKKFCLQIPLALKVFVCCFGINLI